MAADDRMERDLAAGLHAWLDPVAVPHPRWQGSPAQLAVSANVATIEPRRRQLPRTTLLVAAAIALLALVAALWVGGRLEQHPPIVPPRNGQVANPTDMSPTPVPSDAPAPSAAAIVPSPAPGPSADPSAATCLTRWSHTGTVSPVGLTDGIRIWELSGEGGALTFDFLHSIDSVRAITIAATERPFVDEAGRKIHVRGDAFFRLAIRGLTQKTEYTNDDMLAGARLKSRSDHGVSLPIVEARRIQEPRFVYPVVGPGKDSTEVWIIGVERPSCLRVTTGQANDLGETGDHWISVEFDPAPSSKPPLSPSPSS